MSFFKKNGKLSGLIGLMLASSIAQAGSKTVTMPSAGLWGVCAPDRLAEYIRPNTGADSSQSPVEIASNLAETSAEQAILDGKVEVTRGDEILLADSVLFDRVNNIIIAEDQPVYYASPNVAVEARSVRVDIDEKKHVLGQTDYYIAALKAQGGAALLSLDQNTDTATLDEVDYSTCARGSEAWKVRAQRMVLNEQTGRGQAWNVKLLLLDQPVLYLPYLSFPINEERQSGWLVPDSGYETDGGFFIRQPYYYNIAPNQDATLVMGMFSERGLLLGGEYRYLNSWQNLRFAAEVLPQDRLFDKSIWADKYGSDRWSIKFDQAANPIENLYTSALLQRVSDPFYVRDLNDGLGLLDDSYLESRFDLRYQAQTWDILLRAQDFQVLDRAIFPEDPYGRLPQFIFNQQIDLPLGLTGSLYGEAVRFYAPSDPGYPTRPESGTRLDFQPSISARYEKSWGFIAPAVRWRYTDWQIDYADFVDQTTLETDFSRSLPTVSLDAGLFFEKNENNTLWSGIFGQEMTQTLEPRIFYLYTPYRDQQQIPIFDSSTISKSYNWLFIEDRFTGADRVADANQLTTALTTRLIEEETGFERFRLSLGQVQYFESPRVSLGQDRLDDLDESEWIIESELAFTRSLSLRSGIQWSAGSDQTNRSILDLRYQPEPRKLFNVAYRYSRNQDDNGYFGVEEPIEQVDVASYWQVNDNWSAIGRYNYALSTHRVVDSLLGFEYSDCCWAVRTMARHHRYAPDAVDAKWSVYLQFELKGLGSAGRRFDGLLEEAIVGYKEER